MTTWYAQNGSQNIDAAWNGHDTMWNDAADGSGNWLTWSSLGSSDVLNANGKTAIAINVDVTCDTIKTGTGTGDTAGGGFTVAAARTMNCDVLAGTTTCVTDTCSSGTHVINGDITGGSVSGSPSAWTKSGNCNMTITGNLTGGVRPAAYGIALSSANTSGVIQVTGDVTGGAGSGANGIMLSGTGPVTIDGNLTNGATSYAVQMGVDASLTVNGDVIGGAYAGVYLTNGTVTVNEGSIYSTSSAKAISCASLGDVVLNACSVGNNGVEITGTGCSLTLTNTCEVAPTNAIGISLAAAITANMSANITGGSASGCVGVMCSSGSSVLNITGNVTGGTGAEGIKANAATNLPTINVTGNVTGGSGGVGISNVFGGVTTITGNIVDTANYAAVMASKLRMVPGSENYHRVYTGSVYEDLMIASEGGGGGDAFTWLG